MNTPSSDSVDRENSAAQQRLNSRTRDSSVSPRNGIDTVVTFAAKDSIVYTVSGRKLRLHRQAFVKHQAQTLSAELIELHIDKGVMRASTGRDSAGRVIGVPKFTDGKETVYGAELTYNFRTRRGIISMAETKFGDGLFFGERIKRVNDSTFFLRDGCYTTCDNPHPHFYFKAPRMKVIMPDRIYAEPLIVYFSNIPIAALPFGVFMENKQGRRSGILIPQVFFAGAIGDLNSRGIAFERIGYYWAISDTLDAELSGAYYTKGGWLANFKGNYFFSSRFNGDINLSYGQGGFTPNSPPSENWRVSWRHTWDITPFTNISGSIDISSSGFFQTTQLDARQRTQRGIQSQFGIRHTFDNGLPFNLDYRRFQDVGTNEIRQSISGGTSIPQIFPVRELIRSFPSLELTIPPDSWLNDIAVSYRLDAQANILTPSDSLLPGETEGDRRRRIAQARANPFTMRIAHAPSINIAPRLGYFVLSPSISYNEHWYFRRYANRIPTYSTTGTLTLVDEIEQGFFREYSASMSLGISTTLYGIAQPRLWGIQALRHTMRPQISLNYTPNFQADANLVGSYIDTIGGRSQRILYSRYSLDGGVLPSPLVAGIGWSLGNNFEAKIQQDTTETVVQLMQVNLAGSINMAADSMQWSPISMNFSNTFGDGVQLSGTASFSLYDRDTVRVGERALLQEVNRLLWSASKGILRLSQLSFNVNYRLSGNTETQTVQGGLIASGSTPKDTLAQQRIGEEAQIGQRFQRRLDNTYDQVDMFGDSSPGFSPLPLEWSSNITGTFSYSPSSIVGAPPLVSALFTADLTATVDRVWHITANMGVDIVNGTINAPSLSVQRDLHCWDMSFRWQPFGAVQGYFFRVGIKMPQLRDVQFIRQNNPFYRP
ncbi:MAG: putative LPS assembly protein LptD [Bacteroidota bacterium]|nr:putative LPS assembly protein LptD [Candidatus Kapabacteria bacterium]MDW8220856.1 putative LPS assembly protein LptD [Bacteroidota bacterium]